MLRFVNGYIEAVGIRGVLPIIVGCALVSRFLLLYLVR